MFEQTFVDGEKARRRGWAMGGSLLGQALAVLLLAILPLFTTYEVPLHVLESSFFFLTPPPPAPPPPPQVKIQPKQRIERFEEVLRQPKAIPDQVALVDDTPALTALSASPMGMQGGILGGTPGASSTALPSFLAPPPVPRPIKVGGRVQAARILERARPLYPPEAIDEGVSGTVKLAAIIARDGTIKELSLISGHPLLAPAAIEAVQQWRYKPTVLNGRPVEVQTQIDVIFNLVLPPPEETPKKKRRGR